MISKCTSHLLFATLFLCAAASGAGAFDLQGHRGARGLAPENTLAAFAKALEIGVTTLETDLAVTKDGVLVLSHETRLNPDIVRGPDGRWVASPGPVINQRTLAELQNFDVGRIKPLTLYWLQFSKQQPADGSRIPALADLFELVRASGKRPRFNVETKISPDKPGETPDPEKFARLVVDAVRRAGVADRTTVQSFDWRTLVAVKKLAPEIETACITSQTTSPANIQAGRKGPSRWLAGLDLDRYAGSVPRVVKAAGCGTWLPYYGDVSAMSVTQAHALGLKVVPWTVNSSSHMRRAIDMKVDGFVTDYPDRAREVMVEKGLSLP